jgi:hypothetical protein
MNEMMRTQAWRWMKYITNELGVSVKTEIDVVEHKKL